MKMRVCVDARLIQQTGIGTFLRSALSSLSQSKKFDLTLLCHASDTEMAANYASNVSVMQSPIYSAREQLEYLYKIPPCDLFWAPHFNVPLGPIRAKKRVTSVSDVNHLAHYSALSSMQKVYAKLMYNAAFFLSDTLFTISEFSKNEILKWASVRPKIVNVITPAFDFVPNVQVEKKRFILSVGNLKPHKNLLRLVQAYAQVRPQEALYIVGKKEGLKTVDHTLFHEIEKNSFLKQNVFFTGYVTEEKLKELYGQAALFVFPSIYEGYGYPPLEAMASGCPVLASRAASIPEVCGDAVEYVDPFSVDSIASGIRELLGNSERKRELIEKGIALVSKKRKQKNELVDLIHACCSCT